MIPPSAIGASNTRWRAVLRLQPVGAAEHAAEVADVLAEDHDVVVALEHHVHRRAEGDVHRHRRHGSALQLLAAGAGGAVASSRRRPRRCSWRWAGGRRAACRSPRPPWPRHAPARSASARSWRHLSSDQSPRDDEVPLEPLDRVAERPRLPLVGRPVPRRVVGGRVGGDPVGDPLDQRRPVVAPGALARPPRGRDDGEVVVAVDTKCGDAVADRPLGERRPGAAGDAPGTTRSPTGC